MVKKPKTPKPPKAEAVKRIQTQEEIDRAFIGHVRTTVRATPIGPNTVILHLLFDALDRLRV